MTTTHPCPTCAGTGTVNDDEHARLLADQPGQVGTLHPDTSQRAARRPSNVPRFGSQRHKALHVLFHRHYLPGTSILADEGYTAAEVAERIGVSRNQAATRLGELRAAGLAEWARDDNGEFIERATSRSGDTGRVQRITAHGRNVLGKLGAP